MDFMSFSDNVIEIFRFEQRHRLYRVSLKCLIDGHNWILNLQLFYALQEITMRIVDYVIFGSIRRMSEKKIMMRRMSLLLAYRKHAI